MSSTDDVKKSAFDERLREGLPLMSHLIEPPFKIVISDTGVQIDAPCLQFNHTDALGVMRVTFSPEAARRLRDALNQIDFTEPVSAGGGMMQ